MNTMDFQNVPHRLGKSIKDLREILNLTQLELAKQAGVSRTVIYHSKQEKHMPHILNLLHICNALHITPAELFANLFPIGQSKRTLPNVQSCTNPCAEQ